MIRLQFAILFTLFLGISSTVIGQHVGVGTPDPEHKLDVRSSLDTTLHIHNTGDNGILLSTANRLGILNIIDATTGGSRTGILTRINFPFETEGGQDIYTGHQIEFSGICNPPSNCNPSDIFGLKVNIPLESSSGNQYGIYSDVQREGSFAGYFLGRGYFSGDIAIGVVPAGTERFFAYTNEHNRAGRFWSAPDPSSNDVEGIRVSTYSSSTGNNYGGKFYVDGNAGNTYGIHSWVDAQGTNYAGYFTNSSQLGPTRYGIFSEVTGSASSSTMYGVYAHLTGSAGNRAAFGIRSQVEAGASTYQSYGISSINLNSGPNHFAGHFGGKVRIFDGEDANFGSGGYLQIGGYTSNVLFDNNEILARASGEQSTLYIQDDGGDLLLCGQGGTVAIGINFPETVPSEYRLAVDGKGIFEEIRVEVSSSWPDYVFTENYSMRTPSELKSFIDANGHLPNIPPADEVENEGMLLGDMQRRMMEKIEELTLYIIQQDERIRALEAQLDSSNK